MFCKTHVLPPTFYSALEHGRRHKGTEQQRAAEWQRLARKGVRTGLPDLLFLIHGFALAVELKTDTGRQSDAQKVTEAAFKALGHEYALCRSVEQLGEALERHGIPLAANWRLAAKHHDAALDGEPVKKRASKPRAAKPTRRQVETGNRVSLAMARGVV